MLIASFLVSHLVPSGESGQTGLVRVGWSAFLVVLGEDVASLVEKSPHLKHLLTNHLI